MATDKEILDWYMRGWEDEMRGSTSVVPEGIASIAYGAGALDAMVGDDMPSIDYQSDEVILEKIKRREREIDFESYQYEFQMGQILDPKNSDSTSEPEEITLSDRKSATANLKDFCLFSMGDRASHDHFIEVTEWSNFEGYDITIEDFNGRKSISITKGQLEALEKCVGKLREI